MLRFSKEQSTNIISIHYIHLILPTVYYQVSGMDHKLFDPMIKLLGNSPMNFLNMESLLVEGTFIFNKKKQVITIIYFNEYFKSKVNTPLVTHFGCFIIMSLRENVSLRECQRDFLTIT